MDFDFSERSQQLREKLIAFMDERVYHDWHAKLSSRWAISPIMGEPKAKARAAGS